MRLTSGLFALALGGALATAGFQTLAKDAPAPTQGLDPASTAHPSGGRMQQGYLAEPLPDSTLLSPPPPAAGSPAEARDLEAARDATALRNTPRWTTAIADADVFTDKATDAFSCTLGVAIGPQATPKLDHLLRRSMADLARSTAATKRQFVRSRPFMINGEPTCTPGWEKVLRSDGSYPSGHSAIGFGWGLILAELVPERAATIVARGRAFGDSRRICNVHWLSDVEEGRIAAAATVARLHADAAFRADLDHARAELSRSAPSPTRACEQEAAALAG